MKIRRIAITIVASFGLLGGVAATAAPSAHADCNKVYVHAGQNC